jgi:hypothetical protein
VRSRRKSGSTSKCFAGGSLRSIEIEDCRFQIED